MSKKVFSRFFSVLLSVSVLVTAIYTGISVFADTQEYSGGSGTEGDPYLISSAEDIAQLDADTVAGKTVGKHYKLTQDITVNNATIGQNRSAEPLKTGGSGDATEYVPDAVPFEGTFDGNYHTVTYRYDIPYAFGGFFSIIKNATVKNLTVDGVAENPSIIFGSIAAVAMDSTIENCVSKVEVSGGRQFTAGVVAMLQDSTLRLVENRGNVSSGTDLTPLSGSSTNDVIQPKYGFTISYSTTSLYVSGIVAASNGNVLLENVLNTGDVTNKLGRPTDNTYDVAHTAGVLAANPNTGTELNNLVMNSVGNIGNITTAVRTDQGNDRIGGVFGRIERAKYTLNKVWSTGTVTPSKKDNNAINKAQAGTVGGSTDSASQREGNIIVYGVLGKIITTNDEVYVQPDKKCRGEFFGTPNGFGDATNTTVYYDGDLYEPVDGNVTPVKLDLKSADFAAQLGTCWQTTAGGYPSLRHNLYGGGSGTEEDPYIISNAEHLAQLDADTVAVNTAGKYYKLTADIEVTNLTIGQNVAAEALSTAGNGEKVPHAVPFEGTFDGNFHTITYTYNILYGLGGLFSFIDNATVKNLTVAGTAENPSVIFGSVAAIARNSVIENCISKVNVSGGKQMTAGVVAFLEDSTLRNVENHGNIVTAASLSGLSGEGTNNALQSAYALKIAYATTALNTAGVVAMGGGKVILENVFNTGNVTNNLNRDNQYDATHTAGVLATNQGGSVIVMNSVGNTGNITTSDRTASAADRIGGIYARLEGATFTLNKVWATGLITPAKKNNNFDKGQTGVIGGSNSGACVRSGDIILYGLQGKIKDYTKDDHKVRGEFIGTPNGFGDATNTFIYYDGVVYDAVDTNAKAEKLDLKSAAFVEQLGSDWQAVENGYPILRTGAKITDLTVGKPGTDRTVELTPSFDPNVYKYTAKVVNANDKVIFNFTGATGDVTGDVGEKSLDVGKNEFTLTVTSADGAKRDYHFTITRTNEVVSSDSTLKSLSVSGAELNETFSKDTTDYTVNAVWKLKKVTINAEASDGSAEVRGAGEKELEIGLNTFEIKVIAEDDSETTYTLKITREPLFKAGSGTKDDPYQIRNEEDLRNLSIASNESVGKKFDGVYFKQTADIDLRGEQWTPICSSNTNSFAGHYDGNGFTIKNLKIDINDDNLNTFETVTGITALGLFGNMNAGDGYTCSIKNVTAEVSINNDLTTSSPSAAGIIGSVYTSYQATEVPLIENCVVKGSVTCRNSKAGGILGCADNASLKIINCTNYATLKVPTDGFTPQKEDQLRYVGGIAAAIFVHDQQTVITGCVNYGDLTGYCYVGGILGRLSQSASSDRNNGITAENGYQATIGYCANYGDINLGTHDIKEKGNIGGIIGAITDGAHEVKHEAKVKLSNLYNAGTLTVMNYYDSYIGAVVGTHNLLGEIENCYNAGLISVSEERALTAGMIGVLALRDNSEQATMKNCYYWAQNGIDLEGVPVGFPGDQDGVVESVTWQQVSNGELAYMLDNGDSASRTYNWTMDTERGIPVFGSGEQAAIFKAAGGYTIGRNGALITATEPPALDNTDTGDGSDEENDPGAGDNTDADNTSDTENNNSNTDSTSNSGSGSNNSDGTAADNNSDLPGDSNSQNEEITYSLSIDKSKLDARLDVTNYRVILLREKVSIRELSEALVLKNATVAFYDAAGSEITDDSYILTEDTVMKLFNPDGEVIGTFSVVYSTSSTGGDSSGGISPLVIVLIVIAVVCVLGCVLGFVIYRRKKQSGK